MASTSLFNFTSVFKTLVAYFCYEIYYTHGTEALAFNVAWKFFITPVLKTLDEANKKSGITYFRTIIFFVQFSLAFSPRVFKKMHT